ncbi:MAG: DUF5131 family protein [Blastocatellia bacterium]
MSNYSKIEWTDVTWNPVRGCQKISPGCKNCYAEAFAERFRGVPGHPYEQGFDLRLLPEKLLEPFRWTTPKTVFVNSMSDLFQQEVPNEFIIDVARVMNAAIWHTYQVLTKRAERMKILLKRELRFASNANHIWWGVSVEDRKYGLPRIDQLREAPVAVRFLSVEPLIEDIGKIDLTGIHWVIVGGESGPGCRPIARSWVESVLEQCVAANVPFFFKQWGGYPKKKAGRDLNDRTYDEMPIRVIAPMPDRSKRMQLINSLTLNSLTR